ncbi:MAG TPA: MlaD family protein [Pseudonocardia sp.]|uniref:MlaD family protein n=1 Tax=Pseudonocardia sp. TaxID=60912 RepID=UPI002ED7ACC6
MSGQPFPMRVSKARVVAVALVAIGSCTAGAGSYAVQATQQRAIVIAEFRDASPMLVGNDVKLHGVTVGSVAGMTEENGIAKVALDLGPEALPLHTDARATVRPVSLLGERYMDLDTGTTSAPLLQNGGVLPVSQTGQNTDLDEVLNVFDDRTGQSLAAFVAVLGEGVQGNGANLDAAVKALTPAMTQTDQFVKVLQGQNATLSSLVDNLEPVAQSLAQDNGRTMDSLVGSTTSLLNTTSTNVQALDATLQELPSSLAATRKTLGNLADTADDTTPLLRSIRPTTDNLKDISDELVHFSHSADPALDKLVPVLNKGTELLEAARKPSEDLRAAGPDMAATSKGLRPIVEQLDGNIDNVLNFIRYWALTTNGRDGLSHYFRAHLNVEPTAVTGNIPGGPGNANLGGRDPAPDSGQPVNNGPNLPTGLLAPDDSGNGSATGLNEKQESGALGFMLGGNN